MSNIPEVLAPAGSEESLKAAVFAGADAVYLGGQFFGARANAQNFSDEQLKAAAEFCHARGVKVYVTVNTLIKERELPEVMKFIKYLCKIPVDAVIVQDMGLCSLILKHAPKMAVHASTQMSIHTPEGAKRLEEIGVQRVVLAREMSFSEIKCVKNYTNIELEIFIYGSLCMSVSGQCYLSAALGSRSGNRGMCAQPCRLPFEIKGGTGFDLSLKDLSLLDEVSRLSDLGVTSFKIEGRMKRPEYVAASVSVIRSIAHGEKPSGNLRGSLEKVFSRSGFTDGYLKGKLGAGMFGIRSEEDIKSSSKRVYASIHELYRNERKSVPVVITLRGKDEISLTVNDEEGNEVTVWEKAGTGRLDREKCINQLKKTGGTPFFVKTVEAPEDGVNLAISQLNALRRNALGELLKIRENRNEIEFRDSFDFSEKKSLTWAAPKIRGIYTDVSQLSEKSVLFEKLCLPLSSDMQELNKAVDRYSIDREKIIFEIPRVMFGENAVDRVRESIRAWKNKGFKEFLCGNIGACELCIMEGVIVHGGFSLNITNSYSLGFYKQEGLVSTELSFELSENEINDIIASDSSGMETGVMAYGRYEVMLTRNCPGANASCRNCSGTVYMTDRKGVEFPVRCTDISGKSHSTVYNSVPLNLSDKWQSLNADFVTLRFTVENSVECDEIIDSFLKNEKPCGNYTRGMIKRGVI